MPTQTDTSLDQLASSSARFVMFTESYGEYGTQRSVWVNPRLVTRVAEYRPFKSAGQERERHSFIHISGEEYALHVIEGPIYVVACLQEALS